MLLEIKNLFVNVGEREILSGINLFLEEGELSFLTGPNGSGKSSLLNTIIGIPKYEVKNGSILFNKRDLLRLSLTERAKIGVGIAFQYLPKIKGLLLKDLLTLISQKYGTPKETLEYYIDFLRVRELLERDVNVNFSGGEMKRVELLTLLVQRPKLALIDEPDSGVDVENVKIVSYAIKELLSEGSSALVVTHTGNVIKYIPDARAYVMLNGKIMCYGNAVDVFKDISTLGFDGCVQCKRKKN
ncbi:MAG: ATP-binding cassette domain-containing protein [Thermoproteota archaeon]|nr:ATP-binding cassette domain-containing protein [Candidatus Brockarchaeota archaeon]